MSAPRVLFGARLRAAREACGLKQFELARRAGVSQAAVSKAETAKELAACGREETLARIAAVLAAPSHPAPAPAAAVEDAVGRAFDHTRHSLRAAADVIEAIQFRHDLIPAEYLPKVADALLSAWTPETSSPERLLVAAFVRSLREVQP